MSLQDDYFDLDDHLKGEYKKKFRRIWRAFCEMENEQEELLAIRGAVRQMVELTFTDKKDKN